MEKSNLSLEDSVGCILDGLKGKEVQQPTNDQPSKETFFSEVEAIDVTLKLIHLLDLIHEKELVFSNLCPEEVFLRDKDIS